MSDADVPASGSRPKKYTHGSPLSLYQHCLPLQMSTAFHAHCMDTVQRKHIIHGLPGVRENFTIGRPSVMKLMSCRCSWRDGGFFLTPQGVEINLSTGGQISEIGGPSGNSHPGAKSTRAEP